MSDTVQPVGAANSGSGFLATLKEYKERISILVFFVGGALWIFAFFATRAQVDELRCLMNANIGFIQSRMEVAGLSELMVQKDRRNILVKFEAVADSRRKG